MGDFGDVLEVLLNTYGKCLSLLQLRQSENRIPRERLQLKRQLRSDRGKLSSVYSDKLSQFGSAFNIGDSKSRLSLRRLVRRLEAAIKNALYAFSTNKTQRLEHASLISLSDACRQEAMRTMSALSSRIYTGQRIRKRGTDSTSNKSQAPRRQMNKRKAQSFTSVSDPWRHESRRNGAHGSVSRASRSVRTMSSDSTKIGEVRRKKEPAENHVRVAYPTPLLYRENLAKKSRNWWNPFRSKN